VFTLLGWLIYGLVVGTISKAIHRGEDPRGFWATVGIGVAGSYVGGLIKYLVGWGDQAFEPSGFLMGIVGGVIFCWLYRKYKTSRVHEAQIVDDHFPK
jgi:uncharacterized membrane protein YeaQ/YmgE (transglycosylase-associated protein family)